MKAFVVAGGRGTRLIPITGDASPKALIPVDGVPLAFRQLRLLARHDIREVTFLAGHLAEALREWLPDEAARLGSVINVLAEDAPRGTAGGLRMALDDVGADPFLVLYGDMAVDLELDRLIRTHEAAGAAATIVSYKSDHPYRSDLLVMDSTGRVTAILPRDRPAGFYPNLVPAGIYCLTRVVCDSIKPDVPQDFVRDVFPDMIRRGERVMAYYTPEYLRDIGTVEGLEAANRDFAEGVPERRRWSHRRPAVFFDRDGVLNLYRPGAIGGAEMELLDGAAAAVRLVNRAGYLAVLVTNQPDVAKGLLSLEELSLAHNKLETLLGMDAAKLDAIYYCPHHPERGFEGEIPALKIDCDCRKPAPGLLRRAAEDLPILLEESCLIGDSCRDMAAARAAGVAAYGVRTGNACQGCAAPHQPERVFPTVLDAVRFALDRFDRAVALRS